MQNEHITEITVETFYTEVFHEVSRHVHDDPYCTEHGKRSLTIPGMEKVRILVRS